MFHGDRSRELGENLAKEKKTARAKYKTSRMYYRTGGLIKHAIKLKTSPARLAQLLQPSLAFCSSLQPMTAHWTYVCMYVCMIDIGSAGGGSKNAVGGRCTTKKVAQTTERQCNVNATTVNSGDLLQLGDVDKLPPVDTPEASSISATRY